ncbi:cytochrome P450 monooxygenase [Fomitiporia mediterranea MF3/22]|uniref:cytochrome P450 monooxygenase n=1 Tax=Fomitiporia mediterranea (strain MF3/22) TaxID=694068 RepID=UPI0004407A96|nr:cytochrome P450 monooxygenase [Fomitiporia mediterranea MF3/22]EJC99287.1 cytochrome P450 monooxygenase [Fomitiporia mediterranea MF3/22]
MVPNIAHNFLLGYSWILLLLPAIILVVHLVSYFVDSKHIRRNDIPGPTLAKVSGSWLGRVALEGRQSEVVHELHKKFGTFVRLSPNHVSISDPEALQVVYGHGNGMLKSEYYDAFAAPNLRRSVFDTRSREEHARKRKAISHIFSQKSVLEFEPYIHTHLTDFFKQWDKLCDGGRKGFSGIEGEGGWKGHDGRVWFNAMPWYNYLSFDIISDLAFGTPFGMIRKARDAVPVAIDHKAAMAQYGQIDTEYRDVKKLVIDTREVPAIQVVNEQGEGVAQIAAFPPLWVPFLRCLPRFAKGMRRVEDFIGLVVLAVANRLAFPTERVDILSKLQQGKGEDGVPLTKEELTSEALVQLIAGSDTTSNTTCAITYYVAANPHVQTKLQKELDNALGHSENHVATYSQIKQLSYLDAVVNEGLRVHSTVGIGLPREVPEGGITVLGKSFPEGTVLSVPIYTIHRDPKVWGKDVDSFRPERWIEGDKAAMQKVFSPFSVGPRACTGRNLALMSLHIFIASIFRRYDIVLEQPDKPLEVHDAFARKPNSCRIGLKRRDV